MKSFWYFLYLVVVCFICFLLPFALFFYETDGDENCCKRFLKALIYTFVSNIVTMLLLFITYVFLKYAELPVHAVSAIGSLSPTTPIDLTALVQTESDVTFEVECSFAVYVIAIMSFFGWILVVIFAGVGLSALPIDMINEFRLRPKARKSD
jgi:LMBR1 domain-containing protein 1